MREPGAEAIVWFLVSFVLFTEAEPEAEAEAVSPGSPGGPVSIGVTLNAIYLSNFLAHFLTSSLMTSNEALRLIRRRHHPSPACHKPQGGWGRGWLGGWGNYRSIEENGELDVRKCL